MPNYTITCCSTADMTREYLNKRNIPFVCFHFNMDGKQYPDDMGKSMPLSKFYKMISAGSDSTSAQVNVQEFTEFFEEILKAGKDVLHISMSSGLSGAYNSACIAKKDLDGKYPGRRIDIIDSLAASSGYGLLLDILADMRNKNASADELIDWIEKNKLNLHHWFFSSDLTSFIKGGRVTKTAGFVGTLLGICPLLNVDANGKLVPREKIRSKKKVIIAMVEKMKKHAKDGTNYNGKCFISNSACLEDAKEVATLIENSFPNLDGKVLINDIGTVVGTHTGPGTVALFFVGDERI